MASAIVYQNNCVNCNAHFTRKTQMIHEIPVEVNPVPVKIKGTRSKRSRSSRKESELKVKVQDALSEIFKLSYTQIHPDNIWGNNSELGLCVQCGNVFEELNKLFIQFNQLRSLESYLAKEIQVVDNIIHQQEKSSTNSVKDQNVYSSQESYSLIGNSTSNVTADDIEPWAKIVKISGGVLDNTLHLNLNDSPVSTSQSNEDSHDFEYEDPMEVIEFNEDLKPILTCEFNDDSQNELILSDVLDENGMEPEKLFEMSKVISYKRKSRFEGNQSFLEPKDTEEFDSADNSEDPLSSISIETGPSYECIKCLKIFPTEQDLIVHRESCRPRRKSQLVTRPNCPPSLPPITLLSTVTTDSSDEGLLSPDDYDSGSSYDSSYGSPSTSSHNHRPENVQKKGHKCSECNKVFFSLWHLMRHEQRHHDLKVSRYSCRVCGEKYWSWEKYVLHKQEHDNNPFPCTQEYCLRKFPNKEKLASHLAKCKLSICTICGKWFKKKHLLDVHMDYHNKTKRYECLELGCGKKFMKKELLRIHQRRDHTGERPYKCTVEGCNYSCISREALRKHGLVHVNTKSILCSFCGRSFKSVPSLKVHMKSHSQGPYKCNDCGNEFEHQAQLGQHSRIHSKKDEEPFVCATCGTTFRQMRYLKRHQRIHNAEKLYQCHICRIVFPDNSTLETHLLMHEAEPEMISVYLI